MEFFTVSREPTIKSTELLERLEAVGVSTNFNTIRSWVMKLGVSPSVGHGKGAKYSEHSLGQIAAAYFLREELNARSKLFSIRSEGITEAFRFIEELKSSVNAPYGTLRPPTEKDNDLPNRSYDLVRNWIFSGGMVEQSFFDLAAFAYFSALAGLKMDGPFSLLFLFLVQQKNPSVGWFEGFQIKTGGPALLSHIRLDGEEQPSLNQVWRKAINYPENVRLRRGYFDIVRGHFGSKAYNKALNQSLESIEVDQDPWLQGQAALLEEELKHQTGKLLAQMKQED